MIRFLLFVLFIGMPFLELALLIHLGSVLGFWPTIGIVLATALIGGYVLHAQGLATMQRVAASMSSGEPPIKPVVDGFFLAISGAFLLTPGVITDGIGMLLLIPPVRHAIARWGFGRAMKSGAFRVETFTTERSGTTKDTFHADPANSHPHRTKGKPRRDDEIIDAEFEEIKK